MTTFEARVAEALLHLAATGPAMREVIAAVGPCRLSPAWHRSPFESLVRAVAYQQLQGRAAEAILGRFLALFAPPFPTPAQSPGRGRRRPARCRLLAQQDPGDPRHRREG